MPREGSILCKPADDGIERGVVYQLTPGMEAARVIAFKTRERELVCLWQYNNYTIRFDTLCVVGEGGQTCLLEVFGSYVENDKMYTTNLLETYVEQFSSQDYA